MNSITLRSHDPMNPGQWDDPSTYYQILLVTPNLLKDKKAQNIETTIVAKTKGEFAGYLIDGVTQEKLEKYGQSQGGIEANNIGSHLPSNGVTFPKGFEDALFPNSHKEINNFYDSTRALLLNRKISQLIAKTWYIYLEATQGDGDVWKKFVDGQWNEIDTVILDGLIAREIFLFDKKISPDYLEPEDLNAYYPLKKKTTSQGARFLILPSSRGWQGITLSLLMAGQAYYTVDADGRYASGISGTKHYHQISQPIFSTSDITTRYGLEVDWGKYEGDIKELQLTPDKSSVIFTAVIPYPPIPAERNLSFNNIKEWACAEDEGGDLPFYNKREDGTFLVDVKYSSPPYPYIPLSCCT